MRQIIIILLIFLHSKILSQNLSDIKYHSNLKNVLVTENILDDEKHIHWLKSPMRYHSNLNSNVEKEKSVALSAIFSLLLPGMGELYAGNYKNGKYFTISEATLWLAWASMQIYSDWIQNDARSFAVQRAGIQTKGKDDQFFIDIGNFQSIYTYNEQALRDRRDREVYELSSENYWYWQTNTDRERYRQLRLQSVRVQTNSQYILVAILANHIISAINAARLTLKLNDNVSKNVDFNLKADLLGTIVKPCGVQLKLTGSF